MLFQIMNNIYHGPVIKIVGKVILTAALYAVAYGFIKQNLEVKMTYQQFQLLMLFWQMGIVDTFNVLKLFINCGSQYVGIVLSSAAGNFSDIGPKVLLEPVLGLGTGYQFVKVAATVAERRQRIATLAFF